MKIIFVYNADAGFMSGVMDSLHKAISPETYECALCALTYGLLTMDKTWRAYLQSLPFNAVFIIGRSSGPHIRRPVIRSRQSYWIEKEN